MGRGARAAAHRCGRRSAAIEQHGALVVAQLGGDAQRPRLPAQIQHLEDVVDAQLAQRRLRSPLISPARNCRPLLDVSPPRRPEPTAPMRLAARPARDDRVRRGSPSASSPSPAARALERRTARPAASAMTCIPALDRLAIPMLLRQQRALVIQRSWMRRARRPAGWRTRCAASRRRPASNSSSPNASSPSSVTRSRSSRSTSRLDRFSGATQLRATSRPARAWHGRTLGPDPAPPGALIPPRRRCPAAASSHRQLVADHGAIRVERRALHDRRRGVRSAVAGIAVTSPISVQHVGSLGRGTLRASRAAPSAPSIWPALARAAATASRASTSSGDAASSSRRADTPLPRDAARRGRGLRRHQRSGAPTIRAPRIAEPLQRLAEVALAQRTRPRRIVMPVARCGAPDQRAADLGGGPVVQPLRQVVAGHAVRIGQRPGTASTPAPGLSSVNSESSSDAIEREIGDHG